MLPRYCAYSFSAAVLERRDTKARWLSKLGDAQFPSQYAPFGFLLNEQSQRGNTLKKIAAALFVFANLALLSAPARADVIQFTGATGPNVNGESIYPYSMSVNGAPAVGMMCINLNLSIGGGETWNVTPTAIPLDSSQMSIDYRALALIFSGISTGAYGISAADYQYAAWSIFDPAIIGTNSAYTPTAATVRASALAYAVHPGNFDYSSFTVYIPTGDTTGWQYGQPQSFISETGGIPVPHLDVVPTPEPSGLMLLGTGVIGVASIVRRKLVKL